VSEQRTEWQPKRCPTSPGGDTTAWIARVAAPTGTQVLAARGDPGPMPGSRRGPGRPCSPFRPRHRDARWLRRLACCHPSLEARDVLFGPSSAIRHRARPKLGQDPISVQAHVIVRPKVEVPEHRLLIAWTEEPLYVLCEALRTGSSGIVRHGCTRLDVGLPLSVSRVGSGTRALGHRPCSSELAVPKSESWPAAPRSAIAMTRRISILSEGRL